MKFYYRDLNYIGLRKLELKVYTITLKLCLFKYTHYNRLFMPFFSLFFHSQFFFPRCWKDSFSLASSRFFSNLFSALKLHFISNAGGILQTLRWKGFCTSQSVFILTSLQDTSYPPLPYHQCTTCDVWWRFFALRTKPLWYPLPRLGLRKQHLEEGVFHTSTPLPHVPKSTLPKDNPKSCKLTIE